MDLFSGFTSASRTCKFFMMPILTSEFESFRNLFAIGNRSVSVKSGPSIFAISWIEHASVRLVCGSLTDVSLMYKSLKVAHSSFPVT